jgi:hypothetical protein
VWWTCLLAIHCRASVRGYGNSWEVPDPLAPNARFERMSIHGQHGFALTAEAMK